VRPEIITDWRRLYGESWKGAIEDDAFAHPAKFARGLIRRIYEHALGLGWLQPGDTVLDPFGGVALGALHALGHGLNWIGMELEERFVLMGNRNIQRWENVLRARGNGHGRAYLYHGDSRYLGLLLGLRANGCVSSPPYAGSLGSGTSGIDWSKQADRETVHPHGWDGKTYGSQRAQLGAMPEGEFQAAVSSPPFVDAIGSDDPQKRGGLYRDPKRANDVNLTGEYGSSLGQLGRMGAGNFEACVSSPPYEGSLGNNHNPEGDIGRALSSGHTLESMRNPGGQLRYKFEYGIGIGQLGEERGDTFWAAARQVVEQTYQALAPGAHAIWVVKDFVRNGERVPFTHQWAQLCEACGFVWLHEHRAWVVEDYGTQLGFFEDQPIVKERKSFFRRLAEKNGAPRIDWESVLCFERPL